ncbi:MAG TPA: carboxypeptidase regulatory-like domain-containing protein [Candidatus Acidoferrum sp.]|nr:carboxypeptidase regulatory-like domain-containing protein [Candidatus Acidoferrum sp.]
MRASRKSVFATLISVGVVLVLFSCWRVLPVLADLTGDIQGTVLDAANAGVPDAKVTIKNLQTGATRTVLTNQAGEFSAPQLEIGKYRVSIEKAGFKLYSEDAVVKSGEKTRIDAQMQVGALTETIMVESGAEPSLDVATAQVSDSISGQEALELPNLARDPVLYATLSPGMVPVSANNPFLGMGSFDANGSRGRANNITLDGVTASDISTTGESGAAFVQDSVAEVKIITNNFDAEFGRNSGSQVQIITKSGTNSYHGSAYEYYQGSGLGDARGYFTPTNPNGTPGPVPKLVQNQGGGDIGGPLYKNHTFIYGQGEVDRTRGAGAAVVANVLTPAQVAGITNPTSLALFNSNGAFSSPTGSLNESSANLLNGDTWVVRLDQNLRGGKDQLFVKYGQSPSQSISPSLTFIGTNLPGFGASNTVTPRDITVGYAATITSSLINNFRFGFGRSNPAFPANSPYKQTAQVVFLDGTSSFGESDIIPQGRTQNTFQYLDTVSWTKGRHTIKVGADFNRYQAPSFFDALKDGVMVFADVAAFQSGTPSFFQQFIGNTHLHNFAFDAFSFVQDDYRLTPTLTLNLGFRLESSGGVSEGKNQMSNLDPNNHTPLGALGTGALGGVDLGGDAFHRNWNPAPRIGVAWNPSRGKLVFRAGYGIAYDFIYQNPITNLRFSPPFVNIVTVVGSGISGSNSYANLVAGTSGAQASAQAAIGKFDPTQSDFGAFSPVDQNLNNPRNQQWDAGLEYQVMSDLVLKATYVGNHNDHLQVSMPINLVAPSNIPAPPVSVADQNARMSQFLNTFNNEVGGAFGPLNNLVDPRFDGVTQVQSTGTSDYHSLQLEGIRRFKNGLTFDVNYTWAHTLDDISDALGVLINDSALPLDASKPISFQRANSEFDIRQRLVMSYNYQIPFTKRFHGWKKYLLDGWSQSGIFSTQTGLPTTVYAAPINGITDLLLNGTNNGGASVNTAVDGDATQLHPVPFFANYTVPASLPVSEPLLEHNGTSGRNHLRLDGITDYDAAFSKQFKFTEGKYLQIRWETFNVLNHPNFAGYINTFGTGAGSQFNTYTTTSTNARQMQLSGRFIF